MFKWNIHIVVLISLGLLFVSNNRVYGDILENINQAFRSGNCNDLKRWFSDKTELMIEHQEQVCDKQQAQQIIKNFFSKHPPVQFSIKHQGGKGEYKYYIGTMKTKNENYRIYFLIGKEKNKSYIQQVRIKKE
jgi:hypothetical protein